MLISLFISTQIICLAAEVYHEPVVDKSNENSSQQIWHSYTFSTGSGNREELHFSRVGLDANFASVEGVFMWKSLHMQKEVVIIGLGSHYLLVTTYRNENDSYTYKEEIQGSPRSLSVFQKWDAKTQEINNFVVIAVNTTNENFLLKWYKIKNRHLEFLWDWPFHHIITHIDVIKLNNEHKLLLINHAKDIPKNPSADIYNFNIYSYLDIWFFEKIILSDIPSSVSFIDNNDNTFFFMSFPSLETVHIFKYSKSCFETLGEQKHFSAHQKISVFGLKSVTSFQVGFHWYLAIASKHSSIFHMKEDNLFYPSSDLNLGSLSFCLAVPVDTYREDTMLLCDSGSDVFIITWKGKENLQVTGSFTQLACNDDINCLERMHKVSLKDSTAFYYDTHQNILISTESGKPLLFMLVVKLRPLPDKVMLRLNEILKTKSIIEENYKKQVKQIKGFLTNKHGTSEKSMGNDREVFFTSTPKFHTDLESDSFSKNWTETSTVNVLKKTVHYLSDGIKTLRSYFMSNASHHELDPEELLPKNSTGGITFFGTILINELHVSNINGIDINDLLRNSYRKNLMKKIGGIKTLKDLNAKSVNFERIGETLACDVVYSDDLWEQDNRSIINGDITWNGKLEVLGDVKLFSEVGTLSQKTNSQKLNHFEELSFEELEVTNETYIQRSINAQPFILPFHHGHLSIHYLDSINQARIEHMNVKNDLEVIFINGKNYSQLLQQVVLKSNPRVRPLDYIKVDGIFSTRALQARRLNSFSLKDELNSPKWKEQIINSSSKTYIPESNKKIARSPRFKRNIHVFNNLEINGNLFTERINNISWEFLNDTVRKNEPEVTLSSIKNFQNKLKTRKVNLSGILNGRFVDNVLTNFSDQSVRFPQVFDKVIFNSLSLNGFWDGICPKCLNDSVILSSLSNTYASSLIFENECVLFSRGLNVTNSLNGVSVKGGEVNTSTGSFNGSANELKSIKASRVILHGSLRSNNRINNISLIDFNSQRVSLNNSEQIKQDVSRNAMTITGHLYLSSLNNNDVLSIISSGSDTKMINNFFSGKINKIKKLMVNGNVTTLEGINGFNLSRVFEKGLCIKKKGSIKGNVAFENIVHFNNINITNSIDGFPLKDLEKDIVMKHNRVFLNGAKNFSILKVTNDMKARALNGHFIQNIVSLKGDQSMKGAVVVNGQVIVQGNVTSYGRINEVPLPDLLKRFSTQSNSYVWSGDLKFQNELVTVDNLMVGGSIQNKSFKTIIKDSVLKDDSIDISGMKSFQGEVKFKENVAVEDKVYGLNFSKFLADAVFVNKPEKLDGIIIIKEAVLKDLDIAGYFNSSLINNFDVTEWFEESILLDRHEFVNGKKNFEKVRSLQNIKIDFINGHMPSATISLKDQQYIPLLALFPRIHSTSDLSVAGFVNERNLIRQYEDSVLVTGTQTIDGNNVFGKEFVINGRLFVDTIKGRKVNNLLTLDTSQTIRTPLVFSGSVTARRGVEDLQTINEIDLDEWNKKSVSLNREQVLNGLWTVKGNIKTKNIDGEGLLNTINLPDVSKGVRQGRVIAFQTKNETETEFHAQCSNVKELSKQLIKLPYLFQQFEIVHEIETSLIIDSVITFKINNDNYLIVTFLNECRSSFYKWSKGNASFLYLRQINIGSVSKWSVTYSTNTTYLITSSRKSSASCEEDLQQGNIWVFKEGSDKYVHLLTTNAFIDIIQENNTSGSIFTLNETGGLYKWSLKEGENLSSTLIVNVGQGNYRFLDFGVTNGLAVTNGREIKRIEFSDGNVVLKTHSFPNMNIVSLPIKEKNLIALVLKDKIVIYESILGEKIFSVIHTYKAGSLLWFNYGPEKQAFLIVSSHHKLIEVYEYKSVSGLLKKMSIQMYSSRLQSVSLPLANKYQLNKFLVVVQRKKILFLEADMMGDYFPTSETLC